MLGICVMCCFSGSLTHIKSGKLNTFVPWFINKASRRHQWILCHCCHSVCRWWATRRWWCFEMLSKQYTSVANLVCVCLCVCVGACSSWTWRMWVVSVWIILPVFCFSRRKIQENGACGLSECTLEVLFMWENPAHVFVVLAVCLISSPPFWEVWRYTWCCHKGKSFKVWTLT